jgi:CheY-like chemotaxis protein
MKLGDATVLVVDDEPYLREMSARWLVDAGCKKVFTAKDGEAAFDLVKSESIDLLLTDVRMPRVDGMELVRNLAGIGKTVPTAFLSGFGGYQPREMHALGVESVLPKPVEEGDLLAAAETALAERSTLWMDAMPIAPTQSISVRALCLGSEADEETLCLGRGGFCAYWNQPARLGKVAFQCFLADQHRSFTGQGYIRWIWYEEHKIGIEFKYLEESCRAWIAATVVSSRTRSFIPGA